MHIFTYLFWETLWIIFEDADSISNVCLTRVNACGHLRNESASAQISNTGFEQPAQFLNVSPFIT
jgi:hypothetical protein